MPETKSLFISGKFSSDLQMPLNISDNFHYISQMKKRLGNCALEGEVTNDHVESREPNISS